MAPEYLYSDTRNVRITFGGLEFVDSGDIYITHKAKPETKKERTARVAKAMMYASWNVHNRKTETIIDIKQVCKPKHRINYGQIK